MAVLRPWKLSAKAQAMANIAQLVIYITPNGEFVAEIPSPNGGRRKLELQSGSWEETITAALLDRQNELHHQSAEEKALTISLAQQRKARLANERAREIWRNTAINHGLALAKKAVPNINAKRNKKSQKTTGTGKIIDLELL